MKKIISVLLTIILTLGICSISVFATEVTANPTNSKITIDGVEVKFDAYNINGNNYFKLRDIAYALSDTESCFSVNWVAENNSANLIPGEKYVSVGGEMSLGDNVPKSATLSNTNIMVNGNKVTATAYLINNNNYFKLRDLGSLLDFGVDWDEQSQTVEITSKTEEEVDPNFKYILDETLNITNTQFNTMEKNKNSVVQQFLYKDSGMGYVYEKDGDLEIVLPTKRLTIKKQYPILGDVISDKYGCIYIVWGKEDTTKESVEENVFISKYSPNGILVKTAGYYDMYANNMDYVSRIPFVATNTVSVIHEDILVISFGKILYNGHQAGSVLAVNINDLVVVHDWDYVYTAHCFGNDVVWSNNYKDFFFMSEGDAYPRGFHLSSSTISENIFDFYLEPNSNGNMLIVNNTFAQLGGLIETKDGFILCGASAKSISEDAKNESQNLFIQKFYIDDTNQIQFMSGETRNGLTSTDIYDNKNAPLSSVSNYGIKWLTNYSRKNVVRPQIVKAEDKIVIFWSIYDPDNRFCQEAYYMILSDEGEVLVPETPLKHYVNSHEKPIYHNGVVSWVYTNQNKLHLAELKIN